MRTREEERARIATLQMLRYAKQLSDIGVVNHSRRMASQMDLQQLWYRGCTELRITGVGHGAAAGDVGKFWFITGYSVSGGPDIVYVP